MDVKFFASVFEGDSADGVKLGMGLTGGDFWPRVNGCRNLYRGVKPYDMDFEELVCVSDMETGKVFSTLHHLAATAYVYALREANGCGQEQQGPGAVVRAAFDSEGALIEPVCNDVLSVEARQVGGCRCRLVWYYCPLEQEAECAEFRIYTDGGSGEIGFANPIATIERTSARVYGWVSDSVTAGRHRFCVRCTSGGGEQIGGGLVMVDVKTDSPVGAEGLGTEVV